MTLSEPCHTVSPLFGWRGAIAHSTLRPTVRHVALTLSLHMSDLGDSCFPGHAMLMTETGLGDTAVRDALRELRDAGWLTVEPRYANGKQTSNLYTAHIPTQQAKRHRPVAFTTGGRRDDSKGVAETTARPVAEATGRESVSTRATTESGTAAETATPRQVATLITNDYWERAKQATGKSPRGIRHQALVGIIEPFVEAGWEPTQITSALATMRERCRPITRLVLEEHLDGRALRRSAAPPKRDPIVDYVRRQLGVEA